MAEDRNQTRRRNVRRQTADENAEITAYTDESGVVRNWTGTDKAPYVIVCNSVDDPVNVTIAGSSGSGVGVEGVKDHDDPDSAPAVKPIIVGGHATTLAPPSVSAEDDVVRAWFDLEGRQQVNHPQLIAGENLVHHYLAVITKPLAVEQDSYDQEYDDGSSSSLTAKATAGRVYQAYVANESGGALFFQLHNTAAAPGGGAAPYMTPFRVPAQQSLFLDFGPNGHYFDVGITMASSSTFATFAGSAGLHMTILFK